MHIINLILHLIIDFFLIIKIIEKNNIRTSVLCSFFPTEKDY